MYLSFSFIFFQDIEKEVRKEVDEAIAKAKVRSFLWWSFDFINFLFIFVNFN